MSDTEERPGKAKVNIDTQTPDSTSNTVLRYSKDVLLSLHDSPLVCKPENMPPLSSWFGEEAGSPAVAKNILNSSVVSRSTDKSIVLGPPKTNFASSLYGGLKHTTDTKDNTTSSTSKLSSCPSRLRQSEDSIRTHSNNNNNRMPRGPAFVGEKGFHYHHHNNNNNNNNNHHHNKGSDGLERRSSNSFGNQSPHNNNNKRYQQHHHHHSDHQGTDRQSTNSSAGGRREYSRDQRANNRLSHTNHNDGHDRGQERVPEWMDYDPDTKTTTDANDKPDLHGDYTNDLEAWKSSMKKKDGLDDTTDKQQPLKKDTSPQEKTKDNTSLDNLLDLGSLELNPIPSSMDKIASPFFDSSSPTTTAPSSELPSKRGSRFAKFFAKREEATHPSPPPASSPLASVGNTPNGTAQPRSISVNDLFQNPGVSSQQQQVSTDSAKPASDQHLDPIYRGKAMSPNNIRMLSEEDVLQSLGAKKEAVSRHEVSPPDANANAIGFNKVLQILSQPKPAPPSSVSSSPDVNSSPKINSLQTHEKKLQQNGTIVEASSAISSPTARQQPHPSTDMGSSPSIISRESPTSETAAKHKKVNNLFGNNLPTSVLRNMSARSDGRSPSLSSTTTTKSGRFSTDSRNGSPLIGNTLSPSSTHRTPTQQHQHYQQVAHSPSNNHGYHGYPFTATSTTTVTNTNGISTQSPHRQHQEINHSVSSSTTTRSMMMMNPHHQAPRNQQPTNGYDNRMQQQQMYGNGETTGMPPLPPPHPRLLPPTIHPSGPSSMNGPMNRMISPQFMQQQQQTMDPSFMSHPPPPPPQQQQMMGMPGMMPPHLPMRPQGQAGNTGNGVPPPPPFMQPMMPRMPPLPMGMPQQMYANKNPGWNRQ